MADQMDNTTNRNTQPSPKKRRRSNKKRIALIVTAIILFFIAAVLTAAYCVFKLNYYDKTNYVADDDYTVYATLPPGLEEDHSVDEETAQSVDGQIADGLENIRQTIPTFYNVDTGNYTTDEGKKSASRVDNILLVGVDRRDSSWYGNSDAMILVSINYDRGTIYMTSFLRDLSARIPGVGVKKLNAACAYGGPRLLVDTLERNYGINISNYASVDFEAMIHVVDAIGGIDMHVTDDEAEVCNMYVGEMCGLYGESYDAHCFYGGGDLHLDGYQAVAYARNRYTGNTHDFGRADRQRKVLMAIFDTARAGGLASLNSAAQAVLPYVTHNMDEGTVLSYITKLPSLMNYSIEQSYIPYDDLFHYEGEMMVPDMADTVRRLHSTIY